MVLVFGLCFLFLLFRLTQLQRKWTKCICLQGYKSIGDGIVYKEEWDETAEVKKKSEGEESEVKEGGVEESEIDIG